MKISTRVRYGARAMLELGLRIGEGPVPLEELANRQQIPERYLSKIIQDLRRSGLIRSVRGAGGGYALADPPSEVSLLDVWQALEGPLCPVDCIEEPERCKMADRCVTRDVWAELTACAVEVLASATIAELVRRHQERASKYRRDTGTPEIAS